MNTQTPDLEKAQQTPEVQAHVHGPNCNHHHHQSSLAPVIRETPKVGRNEECPCGSHKKFKKCCGK
ncbi:MAG TPA: SEC-C metal-binding domain-containing protein [Bacteriovoracaceae bacterium]|nr:SEC-C metal-binding domain-containing protein [Bacteriovoracaceae bacterium]